MRIAVVGAGLVGCYTGGMLAVAGHDVVFFGRERLAAQVREHGLSVSANKGPERAVPRPVYETDLAALHRDGAAPFDYVLVTLKSVNTLDAVPALQRLPAGTVVVSFQNGVKNAEQLRASCPALRVFAGMFPFNVVQLPPTHFHQATTSPLMVEDAAPTRALAEALTAAGIPTVPHADIAGVLHGKLLLNLNNAINALSGLPLRSELGQWGYRNLLARAMSETLAVYSAAGITTVSTTPLPMWMVPYLFRLPDFIFSVAAASILSIDETARSSMEDDLRHGRPTEIEYINGYVEALGRQHNVPTPTVSALARLIREIEAKKAGSPNLSAAELTAKVDALAAGSA